MKNDEIYVLDLPPITKKAALSCAKSVCQYDALNYYKNKMVWTGSPKLLISWLKKSYQGNDYNEVIVQVEQEMFPFIFGADESS